MKVTPHGEWLLVLMDEQKETMRKGVYVPGTAKETMSKGTVVAAGPGRYTDTGAFIENQFKPGERVFFGRFASEGQPILVGDVEHLMIPAGAVLARLSDEEKVDAVPPA